MKRFPRFGYSWVAAVYGIVNLHPLITKIWAYGRFAENTFNGISTELENLINLFPAISPAAQKIFINDLKFLNNINITLWADFDLMVDRIQN